MEKKDKYDLTPEEYEKCLKKAELRIFMFAEKSDKPTSVFIVAQPGAGKTGLKSYVERQYNGQFIEVDIQGDLARLQTRSKPQYFGGSVHGSKTENGIEIATLDKDIINRTFRKVYQLRDNERFTDEYIMVYSAILRCQGKTPIEMIKFFMDDPKIQKELKNTRCIEASKMYKMILNVCYDFSDGKQFIKGNNHAIIEECILSNDEGEKRYSFCIFAQDKEEKEFYIYSKKSRRMVNFTQEEIKQMTRQVMNVGFGGRKSEIKKEMISFINGDGLDYKESKQEISKTSIDDIFLE